MYLLIDLYYIFILVILQYLLHICVSVLFILWWLNKIQSINQLSNVHVKCKQSSINGYYNIDLLKLQTNSHYNTFYESVIAQGFFPKIIGPTRSFENSYNLVDNNFTNNLNNPHILGTLVHHVSYHFMHFCIVEDNEIHSVNLTKYVETETNSPKSIANFKNSINKASLKS